MLFRLNPSSGVPLYLQLVEQVKHAIEMGAIQPGEQLPTIRKVAEDLVMNPNTVARAYRELEYAGVIEVKHGAGAYVSQSAAGPTKMLRKAQAVAQAAIERLAGFGLTEEEIRRLVENEISLLRAANAKEKSND
jgi:GntR family transcriptional regulator